MAKYRAQLQMCNNDKAAIVEFQNKPEDTSAEVSWWKKLFGK